MSRAAASFLLPRAGRTGLVALAVVLAAGCSASRTGTADSAADGEKVRIGYATADERDVTTSVSSLTEEEVDRVQFNHVEQLLQGRVAGLHVTRLANGEFSVRIRGTRSFSGSGEPLMVVDGIPAMSISRGLQGVAAGDVQRVDVLKGAAATMYGSRGANGVIIITTKRGR